MKKADLKTDMLYAHKRGKYDSATPVRVMSTEYFRDNYGRYGRDHTGQPIFVAAPSAKRAAREFSHTVGILVVSNQQIDYSGRIKDPDRLSDEALMALTLEEVLAAFINGQEQPTGYTARLVNQKDLIGEWAPLQDEKAKAAVATRDYLLRQREQAEALVADTLVHHNALVTLGINAPAPYVADNRQFVQHHPEHGNHYVMGGTAKNIDKIEVSRSEVDRLVALVEHLRGLAMADARSDEDREWIRMLTANDVVKPRVEV